MPLPIMVGLIPFGERMSREAQEETIECKLLGREDESKTMASDVTTIQKNLNSLEKAYQLAMN